MLPEPELLRQLIQFKEGRYFWRARPVAMFPSERAATAWNNRFAGKETLNCPDHYGYNRVSLLGLDIKAHRLIWAFHKGEWPNGIVDHINGIKTDNRLCNLRIVTPAESNKNLPISTKNRSGYGGVTQHKNGRWRARIKVLKCTRHLGYFESFDEAVNAHKSAKEQFGYHENHGRA